VAVREAASVTLKRSPDRHGVNQTDMGTMVNIGRGSSPTDLVPDVQRIPDSPSLAVEIILLI